MVTRRLHDHASPNRALSKRPKGDLKLRHEEKTFEVEVVRRTPVADGIVHLVLRHTHDDAFPVWEPGAHVDLLLEDGLVRQYSLCGDPDDRETLEIAVLREAEGRGGSAYVHEKLHEGSVTRVRGPRNHFQFQHAPSYLFIAGGIGITPLVPMMARATLAGKPWHLAYGGRRRRSMAFAEELVRRYRNRIRICPQDEAGLLDLDEILEARGEGTAVYCCGPEPLLRAVEERTTQWPPGVLHLERFAPKEPDAPRLSTAFEVEVASTGQVVEVPEGKSIVEALEQAGVDVTVSCLEGTCGTCETGVLEGVPDHRDSILSDNEKAQNDTMFICVSRSCTKRLRLDV